MRYHRTLQDINQGGHKMHTHTRTHAHTHVHTHTRTHTYTYTHTHTHTHVHTHTCTHTYTYTHTHTHTQSYTGQVHVSNAILQASIRNKTSQYNVTHRAIDYEIVPITTFHRHHWIIIHRQYMYYGHHSLYINGLSLSGVLCESRWLLFNVIYGEMSVILNKGLFH